MKKILLVLPFILLGVNLYSQSYKNNFIEDSSTLKPYVLGIATNYASIGSIKHYNFGCSLENLIFVPSKTYFFVAGKYHCSGKKFYVIYYKGEKLYIGQDELYVSPENYNVINNIDDSLKASFEDTARYYSNLLYKRDLLLLTDLFEKSSKQGLVILNKRLQDESEYIEGIGLEINVFNPTKKTIKYITFTILGYNAVNDKVGKHIVKKCIGPINPGERGEYEFKYLWLTDIIESCKITNIKIQYMDNSFKTITNSKSIEVPVELKYLISN